MTRNIAVVPRRARDAGFSYVFIAVALLALSTAIVIVMDAWFHHTKQVANVTKVLQTEASMDVALQVLEASAGYCGAPPCASPGLSNSGDPGVAPPSMSGTPGASSGLGQLPPGLFGGQAPVDGWGNPIYYCGWKNSIIADTGLIGTDTARITGGTSSTGYPDLLPGVSYTTATANAVEAAASIALISGGKDNQLPASCSVVMSYTMNNGGLPSGSTIIRIVPAGILAFANVDPYREAGAHPYEWTPSTSMISAIQLCMSRGEAYMPLAPLDLVSGVVDQSDTDGCQQVGSQLLPTSFEPMTVTAAGLVVSETKTMSFSSPVTLRVQSDWPATLVLSGTNTGQTSVVGSGTGPVAIAVTVPAGVAPGTINSALLSIGQQATAFNITFQ